MQGDAGPPGRAVKKYRSVDTSRPAQTARLVLDFRDRNDAKFMTPMREEVPLLGFFLSFYLFIFYFLFFITYFFPLF